MTTQVEIRLVSGCRQQLVSVAEVDASGVLAGSREEIEERFRALLAEVKDGGSGAVVFTVVPR